jgi:hypothetical protein
VKSWQCHLCGTVYAWWVASCNKPHTVQATGANAPRRGHVCFRDRVEQTPGYGHCIVRCIECHRPGIRTWSPTATRRVPVVTWEDEIVDPLPSSTDRP